MRRNVIDEGSKQSVRIKDFCQECSLELARGNALEYITFSSLMVNRPGLLFTGFDDYFGAGRIQLSVTWSIIISIRWEKRTGSRQCADCCPSTCLA